MTKVIPGPEADVAGYMVFKLGAAGGILGLIYGAVFGGGEALSTWLSYSLAVAVTGAFLGSLTWLGKTKRKAERPGAPDLTPPSQRAEARTERAPKEPQAQMRVSAFRTASRAAR